MGPRRHSKTDNIVVIVRTWVPYTVCDSPFHGFLFYSVTRSRPLTISSFMAGALCKLSIALVKGAEVVYRVLCMFMPPLEVQRHKQTPQQILSGVAVSSVVVPNACQRCCVVCFLRSVDRFVFIHDKSC
jgi:hypothetical protein